MGSSSLREDINGKKTFSFGHGPNEGGREGDTPAQIFWNVGVRKKWYKLSKFWGGGVEVIWTKSKRTATFFQTTTTLLF